MNGQATAHYSTNSITNNSDQLIGKFHVSNVDKSATSGHDETTATCPISQPPSADEATSCPSRFQMIRVDRNFGRGRWKVNDYEPPENASSTAPVNASENDPAGMVNTGVLNAPLANATTSTTIPANVPPVAGVDSNGASSNALAATAAVRIEQVSKTAGICMLSHFSQPLLLLLQLQPPFNNNSNA